MKDLKAVVKDIYFLDINTDRFSELLGSYSLDTVPGPQVKCVISFKKLEFFWKNNQKSMV